MVFNNGFVGAARPCIVTVNETIQRLCSRPFFLSGPARLSILAHFSFLKTPGGYRNKRNLNAARRTSF